MDEELDAAVLARRQKDLNGFTQYYQNRLDKTVGDHAKALGPAWQNMAARSKERLTKLYEEIGATEDPTKLKRLTYETERLETLYKQFTQDLTQLEGKLQPYFTSALAQQVEDSVYINSFGLEQAAKVATAIPTITAAQVLGVIANPWLPDKANYSTRLRANTAYLAGKMRKAVSESVERGTGINEAARKLDSVTGEGYHNSVRLMRTELNRAANQGANILFMNNADIMDGKRWNATLDSRTAPKDAKNDGKQYDLDYDTPENPGVAGQRIPNHPNCRCKWTPVLSALGVSKRERIARTGDGPDSWGERTYTKARTYEEYAKERGDLPDLEERITKDNLKAYLRPTENVADLATKVVRANFQGGAISVAKPLWLLANKPPVVTVAEPPAKEAAITGYVDAKNIKEANLWASNNLDVDYVEYKGFDVQLANAINKKVLELQQKYPEGLEGVKWVSTAQDRNKGYVTRRLADKGLDNKEAYIKTYYDKLMASAEARGAVSPDGKAFFRTEAEKAYERDIKYYTKAYKPKPIGGNVWAQATNESWGPQAGITFNEKFSKNYDDLASSSKRNVASKFHVIGAEEPSAIFTHEYGHQVDFYLRREDKDLRDYVIKEYRDGFFKKHGTEAAKLIKDGLSEYALENEAEFFAEAFTEYLHNPNPRPIAAEFGKRLDEALTKIRGRKK